MVRFIKTLKRSEIVNLLFRRSVMENKAMEHIFEMILAARAQIALRQAMTIGRPFSDCKFYTIVYKSEHYMVKRGSHQSIKEGRI